MSLQKHRRRLLGGRYGPDHVLKEDLRNAVGASALFEGVRFEDTKFGQGDFLSAAFVDCSFTRCDMAGIRLLGTTLQKCLFKDTNLDQADFTAANIQDTHFDTCRLQYSSFRRAYFIGGSLTRCDLHGALLDFAQAQRIDYSGSNLWGAVVPLGCQFFVGHRFDHRQIHFFLSLVSHVDGETDEVQRVADPKIRRVVDRLVRGEVDA